MAVKADTTYDIDAVRDAYLSAPDEAIFLERARFLEEAIAKFAGLPPGLRQGKTIEFLCANVSVVVNPCDVLLSRLREEVPSAADARFVKAHPELFHEAGVRGFLDSAGIYAPDWSRLMRLGIGGLLAEVEKYARAAAAANESGDRREWLEGVRTSLAGVSTLARRFAAEARRRAAEAPDAETRERLAQAGAAAENIALSPPASLREALQLYILFHTVLSSIAGGRNVTPGRMDQWLLPLYDADIGKGELTRETAVELLAIAMIQLSQFSGRISTDFQSTKETPNRYSHYYITLGGVDTDGKSAANELSSAILDAVRLVDFREPSISVRYFPGIDKHFWRNALDCMRDGLPVFAYNDRSVIHALVAEGVAEGVARDYVHAGCMNCLLPGSGSPCLRDNLNMPRSILAVMNGGREPLTGRQIGPAVSVNSLADFDSFFDALIAQVAFEIRERAKTYAGLGGRYPLPAWPLVEGHLAAGREYLDRERRHFDLHLTGVATTVDSLLEIDRLVYRDRKLMLSELATILKDDFAGHEHLRQTMIHATASYGSDDAEVVSMTKRVGRMWVDAVRAARQSADGVQLRPGFHSWLYNLELGRETGATPDGRKSREPMSADLIPTRATGRAPTEILRSMAALPQAETCSGGSTVTLDRTHFEGAGGLDRLASLVEGYFAEGGLQLHFIFADRRTLRDAVENPREHAGLLVRVTGYSEYFVRLLPEVQQDIIRRTPDR